MSELDAATSVEYAIMLALIVLACFAAITTVGAETASTMTVNSQEIGNAMRP